jgi:outer membrane lipoprotein-sorting protein
MNPRSFRRALASIASALALALPAAAQVPDAEALVRAAREYQGASSMQARLTMTIAAKDGSTSERLVDEYMAKEGGLSRSMTIFQKPANVQGTRFLVVENKGRDSDRWIFLPALGKSRRIAGGEGGGSFMGTDLSYDDLSPHDASKDRHAILREEAAGGEDCYVIESVAKDPADSQYSKVLSWISKDKSVALRMEMYDKKGSLKKRMEASRLEKVDGIWVSRSYKVETVPDKTSTSIELTIVQFNRKIPAGVFTSKYLETGTP